MAPILFSIGKINFYTHGLLIALGALVGGGMSFYLAKKKHLKRKFLFDALIYSIFAGIIGARLTYIILYYGQFTNWQEVFFIQDGGLVSFGGIFFGFLAGYFLLKKRRENILAWFDLGMIGLLYGWTIGRVGCFLAGDVLGVESSSVIALNNQMPVALLEAGWVFILSSLLLYFYLSPQYQWKRGTFFYLGIAFYALGRFLVDFWRDEGIILWQLKGGQLISLAIMLGIILIFYPNLINFLRPKLIKFKKE